jgi:glycosyltransferase involved in cell wall biosynthesis
VLVDPYDPVSIADGLERAITEREGLVALGRERVAEFTWARTASLTADVYRELV